MTAKALRNIPKLFGAAYETGDKIPDAVIAKISQRTLRSLIDNRTLEVDGMESAGGGIGQHTKAKVDALQARVEKLEKAMSASEKAYRTLQAAYDDLASRIGAPEGAKKAVRRKAPAETQEP